MQMFSKKTAILAISIISFSIILIYSLSSIERWSNSYTGIIFEKSMTVNFGDESKSKNLFEIEEFLISETKNGHNIAKGDTLIAINNIAIHDIDIIKKAIESSSIGDTIHYKIIHNQIQSTISVPKKNPFGNSAITANILINYIVAILFFVIGLFVYIKKSSDNRAVIFFLLSFLFATYFLLELVFKFSSPNLLNSGSLSGIVEHFISTIK